jgi:5'-nucleotidase/UDP-sugar diphosphatase
MPASALRLSIAVSLLAVSFAAAPARAAPKALTLIHVNDTHSHLDAIGPKDAALDGTVGGLWKAASVIAGLRATEANTLLVHGGDLFHGDLFFQMYVGVPELEILTTLGLDAMALGNHEFEWGPGALFLAASTAFPDPAQSPFLSANLDFTGCDPDPAACALQGWVRPSLMREVDGVKVGLFGLTTPYDLIEQPAPLTLRADADLFAIAHATAAALRADGAQVVVLLSHLGLALDRQLAASGLDVDVIVGAHDHVALAAPEALTRPQGGVAWLVEAGDWYRYVGVLRLAVDGASVTLVDGGLVPIDASVPRLAAIAPTMGFLEAQMVAQYGDVFHTALATASAPFPRTWDPAHRRRDTATGNLLTDIYRAHTGTDVALEAMGFQDGELQAGPITGEDVFRLLPYGYDPATRLGFRLATVRMTGAELLKGLEVGVSMISGSDAFLQVSGLRFEYDSCRPPFDRVDPGSVHVSGHRLDPAATYTATVNEGVLRLLPLFGVAVTDAEVLPSPENLLYVVTRDAIAARGTLDPVIQGRIRDVGAHGCR